MNIGLTNLKYSLYALLVLLLLTLVLAVSIGPVAIEFNEVIDSLLFYYTPKSAQLSELHVAVIYELRLPRALLAALVGAILAACGAAMQGLFRNPLADPGIIGVSSGSAVGAVLAICLFPITWQLVTVPLLSSLFGILTTLLVYRLARSEFGTSVYILLLSGVAISAFAGAIIGFMAYFSTDQQLRDLSVWQMGSVAGASTGKIIMLAAALAVCLYYFIRNSNAFNAMLLGEAEARHLGVDVETFKLRLITLTAIAVGLSVAVAGIIGFVGLVVPHLIRMLYGPDHKKLMPLATITGAILLVSADIFSRTVAAPAEVPIGLISALIGAPFFLLLILQQRKTTI